MAATQTSPLIAISEAYVQDLFKGEATGHDWFHINRVRRTALAIARAESGEFDLLVVELSALLHEIGDWKLMPSGDNALWHRLRSAGAQESLIQRIQQVVAEVSFKGAGVDTRPATMEGRIVQDADRLDALGAIGLARTFAYGGKKGQPIHNPAVKPCLHESFDAYRNHDGTTINHFHEKLLLLRDLMNTREGRLLAETRHRVLEDFLRQFQKEWDGLDLRPKLIQVVSGGQTGVDRAALDAALELGIPVGGWCPQGRCAEDGPLPGRYLLLETPASSPAQRTEWNVRDSDGTLVLSHGRLFGGTALTVESAASQNRPRLLVNLREGSEVEAVLEWLIAERIGTLNVAGPRESSEPGIYDAARPYLHELFARWIL